MLHKDLYIGENLTLDLVMKVEIIITRISKEEGREFEEIFIKFLNSNTYKTLKNKDSKFRNKKSELIIEELFKEWRNNLIKY